MIEEGRVERGIRLGGGGVKERVSRGMEDRIENKNLPPYSKKEKVEPEKKFSFQFILLHHFVTVICFHLPTTMYLFTLPRSLKPLSSNPLTARPAVHAKLTAIISKACPRLDPDLAHLRCA